ncbi:PucR family transcriptional regulator [Micromonospora deserti]|uniref:PucR family transcriptional regulator n=1 Tax=Micromonospora deserti TaxID=2070366 RepID=UPI0018F71417|nr:PucR family transcriptional regulator ligand-binding domain-containing protein [Micromonospora deserti]
MLELPVLAAGQPKVICGLGQLSRLVRWVHVTELTDPASFLKGGELVLTTGMPLPTEPTLIRKYVDELAQVGAAGLVIELVRRYRTPPDELVRACRANDLPLIVLSRDVNFVDVTQTVHALILGSQVETLRRAQQVHEAFTALTLRGAQPEELVRAAAEMSGYPVVLENLVHQAMLSESTGRAPTDVLARWERRSRATPSPHQTDVCGPESWLVTPVEYQGEEWGRLVMLPDPTTSPAFGAEHIMVLERAAMALTIARLMQGRPWERAAHRTALLDLVEQRYRSASEARARIEALGVPTDGHRIMIALVTLAGGVDDQAQLEDDLARQLQQAGVPALLAAVSPTRVGMLLALKPSRPWRPVVERLGTHVQGSYPTAVVSVGCEIFDITHAARSFHQAARVAHAAVPDGRPFYEDSDIGLRELLYALRDDLQVQDYVERHIGRLIEHDNRHGSDLLATLHTYLDVAGNKTLAARRQSISRQALYERLRDHRTPPRT